MHNNCKIDSFKFCYYVVLLLIFNTDVLQAAGIVQSAFSKEAAPTRISTLGRSQSSRESRPSTAVHAGRGSILDGGEIDGDTGIFSRARHSSLLSFESIRSSFRADPIMEPATAFESGT